MKYLFEHFNNLINEMDGISPQATWWLSDPEKLRTYIYWLKRQIPPYGEEGVRQWKAFIEQQQAKYPAPASDYDVFLKWFD